MTDIDTQADIELHSSDGHVTVSVPLTGAVTGEWLRCYQQLALATKLPAAVQARQDRAWMVVSVPATSDQGEVAAAMDAARALIAEADAAERSPASAKVEASVRDWWAGRQGNASSSPVAKPGSVRAEAEAEVKAEQRWPMACTLVLALAVPLLLPRRFSLGPPWAVPAVEVLLLAAIIVIDRGRIDRRSALGRVLALVLASVLIADAVGVSGRLVVDLIEGGPETNSAADLLKTGFLVWLYTIIAFTLLYWVLDGGGPEARFLAPRQFPDLAFPQHLSPQAARPGWHPEFFDYLYLGFTAATALSPTDVMPLARWGKFAMTVQAVGSLMVLGLVIARAVNILK
jgi:uncharacterized membrane protein